MKYNYREIMKTAWAKFRRFYLTFAEALRMAWYEAKRKAARYNVYGENIDGDVIVALGLNITDEEAQERKYMNQYRYDVISIVEADRTKRRHTR